MEIKSLEVLVMDNGEVLCNGKQVGYTKNFGQFLMDKMPKTVLDLYAELNKTVVEYESDTFSASGVALTGEESDKITEELVVYALKQLIDCDTLDGVRLSEELENIRPEEQ